MQCTHSLAIRIYWVARNKLSALMQELERAYNTNAVESASSTSCACSPLHRDSSCGDPNCRWVRPRPTFTAEREAQDVEYAAAVRYEEDRDEEERQREEAEQALAGLVQVDVVRAARLRRLEKAAYAVAGCRWLSPASLLLTPIVCPRP